MKNLVCLIALLFSFFVSPVWSVTVSGLYEATVPVEDQSDAARKSGIRAALLQVMVKLTGNRKASGLYGVSNVLDKAEQYLQQYEFRSETDAESEEVSQSLWVRFDANSIQNSIREYNIPVWGQDRPSTLIWMVVDDDAGKHFADLGRSSTYLENLNEQASARGIHFVTPLLDDRDTSTFNGMDVTAANTDALKQASDRYVADAVLAVRVEQAALGLWEAEWLSIINNQEGRWNTSASDASAVIREGVDVLADRLAVVYRQDVVSTQEGSLEILVTGIRDYNGYIKTMRYLQSLNFINEIDVKKAGNDGITFNLVARGGISAIEQASSLSDVLQPSGDGQTFIFIQ